MVIGALGRPRTAQLDAVGGVALDGVGWVLRWWVGADDRWRDPESEVSVRQRRLRGAPIADTRVRIPGGDAVQVVSATRDAVFVEVRNESPAPFVAAFDVGPAQKGAVRSIALDEATVRIDDLVAIELPRPPLRWTTGRDLGDRWDSVTGGRSRAGRFPPVVERAGDAGATLLFPVAHRAAVTLALPLETRRSGEQGSRARPDLDVIARGWRSQLDAGVRVELPDPAWQELADAARATLLLTTSPARRPEPDAVAALEEWGHDREAIACWGTLGWRGRRRARRRQQFGRGELEGLRERASAVGTWSEGPAPFLLALRTILARDAGRGAVEILAELPEAWRGGPLAVRDAPTRAGRVSYAVRWHGARPAVLWECDPGIELRAPGLDPSWSTGDAGGEALLSPRGGA